jgi:hypothetical protein
LKPSTKNPSAATNKGNQRAKQGTNIGSRKHGVFALLILSPPSLLQQRAGLKGYLSQFSTKKSNRGATE